MAIKHIFGGTLLATGLVVGGVEVAYQIGQSWNAYKEANCNADMAGCAPPSKVTGNVPVLIPANDKEGIEKIIKMDVAPGPRP